MGQLLLGSFPVFFVGSGQDFSENFCGVSDGCVEIYGGSWKSSEIFVCEYTYRKNVLKDSLLLHFSLENDENRYMENFTVLRPPI